MKLKPTFIAFFSLFILYNIVYGQIPDFDHYKSICNDTSLNSVIVKEYSLDGDKENIKRIKSYSDHKKLVSKIEYIDKKLFDYFFYSYDNNGRLVFERALNSITGCVSMTRYIYTDDYLSGIVARDKNYLYYTELKYSGNTVTEWAYRNNKLMSCIIHRRIVSADSLTTRRFEVNTDISTDTILFHTLIEDTVHRTVREFSYSSTGNVLTKKITQYDKNWRPESEHYFYGQAAKNEGVSEKIVMYSFEKNKELPYTKRIIYKGDKNFEYTINVKKIDKFPLIRAPDCLY